jgi:2-succinyl-5-enolpyruvyl-6-hydroxy-3-cyclohexene-1-carboxylate synthase
MKYSCIPLAHTLVSLCKDYGVKQVVISPGSRNAPLILGFTGDPYFDCYSIVDERSAGFFALGLSQQSHVPTALVCTSGSALLNYYPAVAEAFYSRIPLVVISADRPPYKIDIGDGQTIRQPGVFEKHIGFQAALLQDLTHAPDRIRHEGRPPGSEKEREQLQGQRQLKNEMLISKALQTAMQSQLPVHLNAPFEEPLYQTREAPAILPVHEKGSDRNTPKPDLETLRSIWGDSAKKMILIGALPPGGLDTETLEILAADPSVLVFTETTSNIHHPGFFPSIDSIMAPLELSERAEELFRSLQPDLLLTLGGMVVSKKIKQFLRKYTPRTHWHVDPFQAPDTYYALEKHIAVPAGSFFRELLAGVPRGGYLYRDVWHRIRTRYEEGRREYLSRIPFSDMVAFDRILKAIPAGIQVQLANSSTVRYVQLFDMGPENPVYCNRGTSGIEGSTSTAVGASTGSGQPVLLITGDLSFFYDSNGLWNKYLRADFRIVVINNQGGGIFRILPGKETSPTFENYFETVQDRSIKAVCDLYGIEHRKAESSRDLSTALNTFFEPSGSPRLLEVKTPRKLNDAVLLGYFDFLSSALGEILRKTDFHE